ncbi:GRAS family protein RAM1-like [Coffea arabica]|uniref:GRAS family protein RAM1-like n=1 Tax=Coffea arabica TaxID=13443 RepID=A0ABM4X7Y8_COFAR
MPTLEEAFTTLQPAVVECQQELPFCQVTQFTAIQAIVDNLAAAKRVHIVDLGIKSGSHWPIIMQAHAGRQECQLELLKITAVGPHKERIEEIGTIAKLKPCVMVMIEIEASTNTPNFLDRFDAALYLCAAVFNCHEDCMERENSCRVLLEGVFIWEGIQNIITTEGEERIHRQEKLEFWRAYWQDLASLK